MSNEKDMHKTGWANIELPPHLKKAREEQEKEISKKKEEDAAEKDLKFTTAEEYMNSESELDLNSSEEAK
ncbi:MAG TPA: hypothetical protein DIC58_12450 [Gammaproteobacteria bacterium]|nr:hypothetical protein [Gammaproteobacteria bacterium]